MWILTIRSLCMRRGFSSQLDSE